MSGEAREMTLDEYVAVLGCGHRAARELSELRAKAGLFDEELPSCECTGSVTMPDARHCSSPAVYLVERDSGARELVCGECTSSTDRRRFELAGGAS